MSVLLLASSSNVHADIPSIRVCSTEWEGTVNADGSGLYLDILKAALAPTKIELVLVPWARARMMFERNACDVLIPENRFEIDLIKPKIYLDSYPLHAIYRKDSFDNYHDSLLEKNRLGWVRGYGIETLLPHQAKYWEFNSTEIGYKVLEKKRIDIFLDYADYWDSTCASKYVDCSNLEIVETGIIESVYPVFRRHSKGKELAKQWDIAMKRLYREGYLKGKFAEYGYSEYTGPNFEDTLKEPKKD